MYYINNTMKSIKTDEDAYWLGFLFADGFVSKNRNRVILELNSKDREHVEKFKKYLDTNRPIYYKERYDTCGIQIDNADLHNNLINYGCIPLKSNIDTSIPEDILKDDNLFWSFLRGFFDGDGSVFWQNDKKIGIFFMGTGNIIDTINKNEILKSINKTKEKRCSNCYYLRTTKHDIIKDVYNKFYSNSELFLKRKKSIFDEYFKMKSSEIGFYKKKHDEIYNRYCELLELNPNITIKEIISILNIPKTTFYSIIKKYK